MAFAFGTQTTNTTISGNTIKNNTGFSKGGGIYIRTYGTVTVTNNTISGNAVYDASVYSSGWSNYKASGGGIFIDKLNNAVQYDYHVRRGSPYTVTIDSNVITGNAATFSSHNNFDSATWEGGGISIHDDSNDTATAMITNNTISGNTVSARAGGDNSYGIGGGIHAYCGGMTITGNTISNNNAISAGISGGYSYGGGIYARGTITNNNIIDNTSDGSGGGIYYGGGTVTSNTISGNTAVKGAAAYGGFDTLKNNSITGNRKTGTTTSSTLYITDAKTRVNYNNIYNNTTDYELWFDVSQGSKNLDAKNNWWGTSDENTINGKIYDGIDDSSKALVDDYPYSTSQHTDTGATVTTTADTTAPTVASTTPTSGAMNVELNAAITATFSEEMNALSITTSSFKVDGDGLLVEGKVSYDRTSKTAKFTPSSSLRSKTCTVTITTGVKDLAGNAMSSNYTWSFTTTAPPVPTPTPSPTPESVTGMIYGTVEDEQENPVEDVTIKLTSSKGYSATKQANSNGAYSFEGLFAGKYTLTATKSGYQTVSESVLLANGAKQEVNITLEAIVVEASLYGTVVGVRGYGIEGVNIALRGLRTKYTDSTTTGKDGVFEFTGLSADKCTLTLKKARYWKKTVSVDVEDGEQKDAGEIVMSRVSNGRVFLMEEAGKKAEK